MVKQKWKVTHPENGTNSSSEYSWQKQNVILTSQIDSKTLRASDKTQNDSTTIHEFINLKSYQIIIITIKDWAFLKWYEQRA